MIITIINYFYCSLEPMRFGVNSAFSRLSDDCDRHRRKRISKSKSSRRRDVYVSPYQPNSSSDEECISDTSVRRKKMPKSKKYVRERKKDQELEKN